MNKTPNSKRIEQNQTDSPFRQPGWTVAKLREELSKQSLPRSGKKEELIQRLEESTLSPKSSPKKQVKDSFSSSSSYNLDLESNDEKELKKSSFVHVEAPSSSGQSKQRFKRTASSTTELSPSPEPSTKQKVTELSLLTSPLLTLKYFVWELYDLCSRLFFYATSHRLLLVLLSLVAIAFLAGRSIQSPYLHAIKEAEDVFAWYLYWVILGIASSIGLGTGLHTFVLFLGPFIAKVTIFAYECGSLDFTTRGNGSFECPASTLVEGSVGVSVLGIFSKVLFEAFAWGAGTAIGELPPYFVARAAALAGKEDEEIDHIETLKLKPRSKLTFWEKVQLFMFDMMQRLGFFGILLSASIPNPLFDLAGITCGHFLIPFSTFFGATFIGKAVFKASIQAWSIILLFSRDSIDAILEYLKRHRPSFHQKASDFFINQKQKFTATAGSQKQSGSSLIADAWNLLIFVMIAYFLLSIVNSLANSRLKKKLSEKSKSPEKETTKQQKKRRISNKTF